MQLTFGGPTDDIDSLVVFGECGKVFDLAIGAVGVNLPDANVVVTTSGSETALAIGFKVSRVDRSVLLVPIDNEGGGLHPDDRVLRRPRGI